MSRNFEHMIRHAKCSIYKFTTELNLQEIGFQKYIKTSRTCFGFFSLFGSKLKFKYGSGKTENNKANENLFYVVKSSVLSLQRVKSMAVSEMPVSITEPNPHTSYDYFAHKYGHKTAMEYKDDLHAIEESLHTASSTTLQTLKRKPRRQKKAKRFPSLSFPQNLEDISEHEENMPLEFGADQKKKDLATIHKERAMTSGYHAKQEGRIFLHKKYHR